MKSLEWCDCFVSYKSESCFASQRKVWDRKVSVMTSPSGSACHSNQPRIPYINWHGHSVTTHTNKGVDNSAYNKLNVYIRLHNYTLCLNTCAYEMHFISFAINRDVEKKNLNWLMWQLLCAQTLFPL